MKKLTVFALIALVALALTAIAAAKEPSSASKAGIPAVKGSAAAAQYDGEEEAAGQVTPEEPGDGGQITSNAPKQDIFTPPVVLSAEQDDAGSLPLTGAALFVPTIMGGAMLAAGLLLLYRTRRRED